MLPTGMPAKLSSFLEKHPGHVRLVEGVPFKKKLESSKNTSLRPVLVLSFHGLTNPQKEQLLADYRDLMTGPYVSFYLWERTTHLFFQNDGKFYDFGFWVIPFFGRELKTKFYRFRDREIKLPNSRRLEPVVAVSAAEKANLTAYFGNLFRKGYRKMLGPYFDPGSQASVAKIDDNRGNPGHNCTSWITTAPIGENGECFIELLGTTRGHQIGTNPGWWAHWMLYFASPERVPFVNYWSPEPLAEILAKQVVPGQPIAWDYNKQ
jgi:hypothetical protein